MHILVCNRLTAADVGLRRILFALMTTIKPPATNLLVGQPAPTAREVITSLQQAGSFRAVVLQQQGQQVLLDTAFGKLTGTTNQRLQPGDGVEARLSGQDNPRLLIEKYLPQTLLIRHAGLAKQLDQSMLSSLVVRVSEQQANKTWLSTGRDLVAIPRRDSLQVGENLSLSARPDGSLMLRRLDTPAILASSLAALSARQSQQQSTYNLPTLQKFTAELLTQDLKALLTRANQKAAALGQQQQSTSGVPVSMGKPATAVSSDKLTLFRTLLQQVNVVKLVARDAAIQPQALQNLVTLLSTPSASGTSATPSLSQTMLQLMSLLKQSPDLMQRFLGQEVLPRHGVQRAAQAEAPVAELGNLLRLELVQQSDQTLNQLLNQQTTNRLQAEHNQPVQINLNIPLVLEHTTQNLKVSIQQHKPSETGEFEDAWDVQLSFEFGLLGLITTKINLRDDQISASFWAVKPSTMEAIDSNLDQFRQQLIRRGFQPDTLVAYLGTAPEPDNEYHYPIPENLVDLNV